MGWMGREGETDRRMWTGQLSGQKHLGLALASDNVPCSGISWAQLCWGPGNLDKAARLLRLSVLRADTLLWVRFKNVALESVT